jgi:hypothetical protein
MATVVSGEQRKQPFVLRPRFLVPFVLALAVLLGAAVYGMVRPHNHVQLKGPGTTNKLHWGGGVFTSKTELRAWLNAHGKSYAAFARAHPAAVRMLPAETATP